MGRDLGGGDPDRQPGWTAEFRIPLSQLRYATTGNNTFGFGVWRDIQRHGERVSWPLWRRTVNGLSSQLGEIPAVTQDPGGFNFKQLRANLVLRWEYRPGSSLFVVWNQGRTGSVDEEGNRSITGDFRDLFRLRADNTLLIKASYWLNR